MSGLVLARKYRPRRLDEVVGQPVVKRTLSNALKSNNLHHAYLFVGQIGGGKTTMSRILAASENCPNSPGLYPDVDCQFCQPIFEGRHKDILEVDAASSAGKVDQIRELKKEAYMGTVEGAKTKYFIIDESHRMSEESNDALLKLLEEPPVNTRFVLCTTDPQKMRPAIESRCQRHDFVKIFWSQIADYLEMVCKKEGISYEIGALNLCARMSEGSMRSGLQNLEKLISYCEGQSLTTSDTEKMFGQVNETAYYDLVDEFIGVNSGVPDSSTAFKIFNNMFRQGAKYSSISNGLANHLQNLLVAMTAQQAADLVYVGEEAKRRLQRQIKHIKEQKKTAAILRSLEKLSAANFAVQYNISEELALRKWFVESVFEFRSK